MDYFERTYRENQELKYMIVLNNIVASILIKE